MSRLLENAQHDLTYLRNQRAKLFKAFDIYKENVNYGLISETQETHNKLAQWYQECLDLNYNSIMSCPSELEKYL